MDQIKEWYYMNQENTQKGPVPAQVLLVLLEKGILPNTTLVWKAGMNQWQPVSTIDPFKDVISFISSQWYYIDRQGHQHGPILSTLLMTKLKDGMIDGLTLVFSSSHTKEWTKLSEVSYLKEFIQKSIINDDDNDDNDDYDNTIQLISTNNNINNNNENDIQQQTFNLDNDYSNQPVYTFPVKKAPPPLSSEKKMFKADDGMKYCWDEEEQDWVEYEGNSADEDDEDDDNNSDDDNDHNHNNKKYKKNVTFKQNKNDKSDDNKTDHQDNTSTNDAKQKKRKRKTKKGPNTWIYVTGLPPDITTEELQSHFSKVGLIALNPLNQQPKIKIYLTDDGNCKGDCSICYNAIESVQMALNILHDGYIRPSHKIEVTQAEFIIDSKDNNNKDSNKKSNTKTISQAQIKTAQRAMKQALAWNEDDDIGVIKSQALKIIVLEGLFDPNDFKDPKFEEDLEKDVATECEKFGQISKMTLFSKNQRGIVIVKFETGYAAQETIKHMNGRFFGGKKIKAFYWDGVTDYTVSSSSVEDEEKEEDERLNAFGNWLEKEQDDLPEEFKLRTED